VSVSLEIEHESALSDEARALLPRLAKRAWADEVYLAGSAALTLYLGHREVFTVDLMSASNRLAPPDRRDLLQDLLDTDAETRVETARDGLLHVRTGSGVSLRFFYYPYPLIDSEREIDGLYVASALDLGLMKLGAIISRGTKRDFADLYLLCQTLSLAELLERSPSKFGHVRDFPVQALKGLTDFSAAESGSMGALRGPLEWSVVEDWHRHEATELARTRFELASDTRPDNSPKPTIKE